MIEPDRRSALTLVAGLGIAGGLALAGCSKAADGTDHTDTSRNGDDDEGGKVTANEDLMREHGVLRRVLVLYREVSPRLVVNLRSVDAKAIAGAATLFRRFGERYHEQLLEERHIFPIVRKAGGEGSGLVDTLLTQHARGRAITDYILDRTKSGSIASGDAEAVAKVMLSFSRMYEAHTAREDTIIFPTFKKALGEKKYGELGEQFEDIERKEFGGDGFHMALEQIQKIETALGVADLGAFTAPAPAGPSGM